MPKLYERRTKRHMDPVGGNQDEGGSSDPVVRSTRELRPRGQKRPQDDDIVEESAGESSDSSDDEIEDSTFRVEHRHGKGPANGSGSDEEEEEGDISDNDEEEEGGSEESEQEIPFHITQRPIRLGSRRCIDYSGSGMTREV